MLSFPSRHPRRYQTLTVLWIGLIFAFSLQDGTQSSLSSGLITQTLKELLALMEIYPNPILLSWVVRKTAHLLEYTVLGVLALKSAPLYKEYPFFWMVFAIPWMDEGLQSLIPGRAGTLSDVFIDTLGLALAYGVMVVIHRQKKAP